MDLKFILKVLLCHQVVTSCISSQDEELIIEAQINQDIDNVKQGLKAKINLSALKQKVPKLDGIVHLFLQIS